ncbi:MAG: AroM family protein, partial [Deltaproteobacteria bacterium]|nr:AroM family protein [Deltaproteobacteria bacterium]
GQSPRPQNVKELRRILGEGMQIIEAGCLDGLSDSEIKTLTPNGSNDTLYTKLPTGKEVVISKNEVTKRAKAHLEAFEKQGLDVVLMFCTGAFHGLRTRGCVIFPSAVLEGYLQAVLPEGRLGVFTPLPSQVDQTMNKWKRPNWELTVVPLIPSSESEEVIGSAAERMVRGKPDLIALDCMGYTQKMKERIRSRTGIRTVLAVSLAARAVHELID